MISFMVKYENMRRSERAEVDPGILVIPATIMGYFALSMGAIFTHLVYSYFKERGVMQIPTPRETIKYDEHLHRISNLRNQPSQIEKELRAN